MVVGVVQEDEVVGDCREPCCHRYPRARARFEGQERGHAELLELLDQSRQKRPQLLVHARSAGQIADGVDHQAPYLAFPNAIGDDREELGRADALGGHVQNLDHAAVGRLRERQTHGRRAGSQLRRPLLQREIERVLATLRARQDELHAQRRLAGAGAAHHDCRAPLEQPALEQIVQPGHTAREPPGRVERWRRLVRDELLRVSREDLHAGRTDLERVPPAHVRGVAQLVDLDVPLTAQLLLDGREQHDPVDDGLLHAEAADPVFPVRNVRRKEADRARVVHDRAEVEEPLAAGLRIAQLVQEDRQRIDRDAARAHGLDAVAHHRQVLVDGDLGLRNEDDLDQPALDLLVEVPSKPRARACSRSSVSSKEKRIPFSPPSAPR